METDHKNGPHISHAFLGKIDTSESRKKFGESLKESIQKMQNENSRTEFIEMGTRLRKTNHGFCRG